MYVIGGFDIFWFANYTAMVNAIVIFIIISVKFRLIRFMICDKTQQALELLRKCKI